MTREEAITTLEDIDKMFIGKCPHEAIDMAIEALRDVPDTNVGHLSSFTISISIAISLSVFIRLSLEAESKYFLLIFSFIFVS